MPHIIKRRITNIHRKRKFTPQTRNLLYNALRTDMPIGRAVAIVGIDRSTFTRWMQKGKDAQQQAILADTLLNSFGKRKR